MSLVNFLQEKGILISKKGNYFVTRCPFCKGDNKISSHNAQINENNIYCYSEHRTYSLSDLEKHFGELSQVSLITNEYEGIKSFSLQDYIKNYIKNGYQVTAEYKYRDIFGNLSYIVYRLEHNTKKDKKNKPEKSFSYFSPDGFPGLRGREKIPYGLEQFSSLHKYTTIFLTEGEKCAETLKAHLPENDEKTVVLSYAQSKELSPFMNYFKNKEVIIFSDNDDAGKKRAETCKTLLKEVTNNVRIVDFLEFEDGYDVADFLTSYSWNELVKRIYTVDNTSKITPISTEQVDSNNQNIVLDYNSLIACSKEIEHIYINPASFLKKGIIDVPKEESFILEPFIPNNSIIIFDGLGETGKSFLAMQLSICISNSIPFLSLMPNANISNKNVIYLTAEETPYQFNLRLMSLAKALNLKDINNFFWLSVYDPNFPCKSYRINTDFYIFLDKILETITPSFIVLDSLINFYGNDENSSEKTSAFMEALKMLIKKHNCSILLLHHQTKEAMRGNEKIFRGSGVFREQARCRFYIEKKDNNIKILNIEKLNTYTSKKREYFIRHATITETGEHCSCYVEILPPPKNQEKGDKYEEKKQFA